MEDLYISRSLDDIYADTLYNPDWFVSDTEQGAPSNQAPITDNGLFKRRLEAAHHHTASSIMNSKDKSPFKPESPFSPVSKQIECSRTIRPHILMPKFLTPKK